MSFKSAADVYREAKQRIAQLSPTELREMRERGERLTIIDVREDREWNLGHIPGAVHMSRGTLEGKIDKVIDRGERIVLYCGGGNRSALAAESLRQMGYGDVHSLAEGFRGWVYSGGEVDDE